MNQLHIDWLSNTTVAGVSLTNWLLALLVAVVAYLVLTRAVALVSRRLTSAASHTTTRIDDMLVEVLSDTNRGLLLLMSVLIGLSMLDLPDRWAARTSQLWFVAMALQIGLWANKAVTLDIRRHGAKAALGHGASTSAAATLISWGLRAILWSIVLLAMLSNMGVNVTAFVASLGVGGIAVALAAQSILGDLFASVAIAVDKPFEVGDFIATSNVSGTVETVGVKTTRIRSLGGEQIVMSNTELLKHTISNYKRLQERRIVFSFGITYDATPAQLREVPQKVKQVVQESSDLRFDRAHFKAFGESSLDFEVVYIVQAPEFNKYMDEQQRINIRLKEEFEAMGVEFAFPTRTVVMAGPVAVAAKQDAEAATTGSFSAATMGSIGAAPSAAR